jgi:hypothetical protein
MKFYAPFKPTVLTEVEKVYIGFDHPIRHDTERTGYKSFMFIPMTWNDKIYYAEERSGLVMGTDFDEIERRIDAQFYPQLDHLAIEYAKRAQGIALMVSISDFFQLYDNEYGT